MVKSPPAVTPKPRFGPNLDSTTRQEDHPAWPLQAIILLLVIYARISHPFHTPPACIAHTVAILLHGYWVMMMYTPERHLPTSGQHGPAPSGTPPLAQPPPPPQTRETQSHSAPLGNIQPPFCMPDTILYWS